MSDNKTTNEEPKSQAKGNENETYNSQPVDSDVESPNTVVPKNEAKTEKRRLQRQRQRERQKEAQMRRAKEAASPQGDIFIPAPRRKPQYRRSPSFSISIRIPRRGLRAEFDIPNPWE